MKSIDSLPSRLMKDFEEEYGSLYEWIGPDFNLEKEFDSSNSLSSSSNTRKLCKDLFMFRGLGIALSNLQSESKMNEMENTPENESEFVRGCISAQKELQP
jgi:hypothetical protein